MNKRVKIMIIAIFVIIVLLLASYLNAVGQNYIIQITDTSELYQLSDAYIYFGRENCPSCELFLPLLEEVTKEEKIQIYYFDTNYFRDNSLLTETELQAVFEEYRVEEVPVIISVKAGEVNGAYGATFTLEQADNIKKDIREFLSGPQNLAEYVPQYTVLIILLFVSFLTLFSALYFTKRHVSQNVILILRLSAVSVISLLLLFVIPTLEYIEQKRLSVMPVMGIVFVISVCASVATLVVSMKVSVNKEK